MAFMPKERSLKSILSGFFRRVGSATKTKRVATSSALEQSSIKIPRTALGQGAAFGEKFQNGDLLFAVKREPVAYKTVFQVAHDIFDKWFEVQDIREKGKDEDLDANVQAELIKLDAKTAFTQAAVYERGFGWSIIVIGYKDQGETLEDELKEVESIEDLAAYSPRQIGTRDLKLDKDPDSKRYGWPVIYPVKRETNGTYTKVHYTRVIHFATRILEPGYKGISVLSPCWDDLTNLRNCRWGMGQTLYRYGSGFPVVTLEGASKEDLTEFSNYWGPLTARTSLFKNEKQEIEFKGLEGRALNPEPYYIPIMENLSAATGIPMAILRGAQAGELTGSEVNEREFFKVVSDAQMRFEPGVRFLIDQLIDLGQVKTSVPPGEYQVDWIGAFEINPRDKEAALLDHVRARTAQTEYMTVNEVRAQENLAAVDGGDVVLGLLKAQAAAFNSQGMTAPKGADKPSKRKTELMKKFGKPVKFLLAERIKRRDSVHKICKDLGISTKTFYQWAEEYGLYNSFNQGPKR